MTDTETHTEQIEFSLPVASIEDLKGGAIHRAILAVVRALPGIEKNGELSFGGGQPVKFTKVEDIENALNPILARYGIVSYPEVVEVKTELQVANEKWSLLQYVDDADAPGKRVLLPGREVRDGSVPNTRSWAEVTYALRFVYVGDNSDVIATAVGQAYDTNSDKAVGKASTAALKRILKTVFKVVEPGEDHEGDDVAGTNRPATTDTVLPGEGGDRGSQARAAAEVAAVTGSTRRSGPARPASPAPVTEAQQAADETHADVSTSELPEPNEPPAPSALDGHKERLRIAVKQMGYTPDQVNTIATEVTGKADRAKWILVTTDVKKIADKMEEIVKAARP